ncbi:PACE efflux transporter [Halomonas halocynthiae]|uniref:PACE efflux transporter n=1 Tax=Halomonas halocynthiae TaxID=176290 RepID=UPI00041E7483|nr:PACE efflux transporter [Halomonas halocynthiae]
MRTWKERVVHMSLFELGGLLIVTPLASWLSGHGLLEIGGLAAVIATMAMLWNLVWNRIFDLWVPSRRRTLRQRFAQAMGFELGLLVTTLPLIAWWLEIGLLDAFVMDIGFMIFFLLYAMGFNTLFDHLMLRLLAARSSV